MTTDVLIIGGNTASIVAATNTPKKCNNTYKRIESNGILWCTFDNI